VTPCDVAIIGAGPYGLSVAAHLRACGIDHRIFGNPMETWMEHMPAGMCLKSEGFASSLSDPGSTLTLAKYCMQQDLPYADVDMPVPLSTFISYGLEFQRRFVPHLERRRIVSVHRATDAFRLLLDNSETIVAKKVVIAVGLSYYPYIPSTLSNLPETHRSHSSEHHSVQGFKDRDVVIVGAGASALDLAAELRNVGAIVQIVCRKPAIHIHDAPDPRRRSLIERLRSPMTAIGQGWKLYWCIHAPQLFRLLPQNFRAEKATKIPGPAGGWFIKDRVVGKVPFNPGLALASATVVDGRVNLQFTDDAGARRTLVTDHVIAATGYKVDLRRLTFMGQDIQTGIRTFMHTPILSANFESSVRGLYFIGTSAANTFGPLLRFVCGARFTARRISRHVARSRKHEYIRSGLQPCASMEESDPVRFRR